MRTGGIIASAMLGGLAGAGQGMAAGAKMAYDEELERRKQALLAQREAQLTRLRHEQDQPNKERELAIRERGAASEEARIAEMGRHNMAMEDHRVREIEQQGRHQTASLAEHVKDRQSREAQAKRNAKNITTLDDGTLATYNPDTNSMDPIRDPVTGERIKGQKDLSLADKTKVAFLQSSILGLQKERAKPEVMLREGAAESLDRDIREYRRQLYGILGMEERKAQPSGTAAPGGGKPWEKFRHPNAR